MSNTEKAPVFLIKDFLKAECTLTLSRDTEIICYLQIMSYSLHPILGENKLKYKTIISLFTSYDGHGFLKGHQITSFNRELMI